jgi:hypothetical protein
MANVATLLIWQQKILEVWQVLGENVGIKRIKTARQPKSPRRLVWKNQKYLPVRIPNSGCPPTG